jgi:hypothetical protein
MAGFLCLLNISLVGSASAQARRAATANLNLTANNSAAVRETVDFSTPGAGCDTTNGTRFNLEPRVSPIPQNSESVAFFLNGAGQGVDLIVGAGNEGTNNPTSRFGVNVFDAYYVHRQGANCNPDFEGTLPFNSSGALDPTAVADTARGNFFLSDIALSLGPLVELARTTSKTLLSTTACPNGTNKDGFNPNCWPMGTVVSFAPPNSNDDFVLLRQHLAVDSRTSGTGAGNVYVVAEVVDLSKGVTTIQIVSCSNASLTCGSPATVSGTDAFTLDPWVQVRQDGLVTVSYVNRIKQPPAPSQIKFVTCQPQNSPNPPVCSTPALVTTQNIIFDGYAPAGDDFNILLYPRHVNRLESNGTFTTFLIYDRCSTLLTPPQIALDPVCSKVDVVLGDSTDGGASWSTFRPVESALGHRFMGTISNDTSTGITNIAYYSTQNDPFLQRPQIFLSQIPAGSTAPGAAIVLTSNPTDLNVGVQDVTIFGSLRDVGFGIGSASAGTGTPGQSKLYVHYTSTNVFGAYNGLQQPDQNNTLVEFSY